MPLPSVEQSGLSMIVRLSGPDNAMTYIVVSVVHSEYSVTWQTRWLFEAARAKARLNSIIPLLGSLDQAWHTTKQKFTLHSIVVA